MTAYPQQSTIGRPPVWHGWPLAFLLTLLLVVLFWDAINELMRIWSNREEYSHGFFLPLASAYLAWTAWPEVERTRWRPSWLGALVCLLGLVLLLLGELSTLYVLIQYALVVVLAGLALTAFGWSASRPLWAPIVLLLFMIPLPPFLHFKLSAALQLISSKLGVEMIRWCDISVYLEGNVIDLGTYKLQVVEACSGLRYLFPLASFGFICAYLFRAPLWHRAFVLVSTVPITLITNSFRIAVTGILVELYGIEVADGFMHYFEGWVIFMACVAILLAEIWLLAKLLPGRPAMREVFGIDVPRRGRDANHPRRRVWSRPMALCTAFLGAFALVTSAVERRVDAVPSRTALSDFPMHLQGWEGRSLPIESKVLEVLDVSDYLFADYALADDAVNLYVAYYDSQRKGGSAHSPRACIPAGGWEIMNLSTVPVERQQGPPFLVNRVEIERGGQRQLVYYWFQQRGRLLTSEYLVKAYLLWDGIVRSRTDGALVRITTPLASRESWSSADERLSAFSARAVNELPRFVPP